MKKIVDDLSSIVAFLVTAAAITLLSYQLTIFFQKIFQAMPSFQLTRGF